MMTLLAYHNSECIRCLYTGPPPGFATASGSAGGGKSSSNLGGSSSSNGAGPSVASASDASAAAPAASTSQQAAAKEESSADEEASTSADAELEALTQQLGSLAQVSQASHQRWEEKHQSRQLNEETQSETMTPSPVCCLKACFKLFWRARLHAELQRLHAELQSWWDCVMSAATSILVSVLLCPTDVGLHPAHVPKHEIVPDE